MLRLQSLSLERRIGDGLSMIPKSMEAFLQKVIPERTWQNRLVCEDGLCYMEFSVVDIERLSRLGITVDQLGPKLVACIWDADSSSGWWVLVVDNLAMGRPALGGSVCFPDLSPAEVFYRARGMTLAMRCQFTVWRL
jgi:glutamate dehydrogenase (NAD(P)+)